MATANRRILEIDGETVQTKANSIDVDAGGLSGEPENSDSEFAGVSHKFENGKVDAEIILNGKEDQEWWNPRIPRQVIVYFPDVTEGTKGYAFDGMICVVTRQSNGPTAKISFVGPVGQGIQ